jgi:hypothetical protein
MMEYDAKDAAIDAAVRAAAQHPTDEGRLAQGVLRRLRQDDPGLFGLFTQGWRLAPPAFAIVLIATPLIIASLPPPGEEDMVAGLILGAPMFAELALDDDEVIE